MGTQRLSCPICFNVYDEHSSLSVLTGCGHLFHTKCIEKWLDGNLNCPSCRTGLEDRYASLLRVYSPTALCESSDGFTTPRERERFNLRRHEFGEGEESRRRIRLSEIRAGVEDRRQTLHTDLRNCENLVASLRDQLRSTSATVRRQVCEKAELALTVDALKTEMRRMYADQQAQQHEIDRLTALLTECLDEHDIIERNMQDKEEALKAELDGLSTRLDSANSEKEGLQEELREVKARLQVEAEDQRSILKEKERRWTEEIHEMWQGKEAAQYGLRETTVELETLRSQLEDLKKSGKDAGQKTESTLNDPLEDENSALKRKVIILQKRCEQLHKEVSLLMQEKRAALDTSFALQTQNHATRAELEDVVAELRKEQKKSLQLLKDANTMENEFLAMCEKVKELGDSFVATRNSLERVQTRNEELEGAMKRLRITAVRKNETRR
ncbi:hypothetical protein QR680_014839 [Steinernema hermaphroditum]|uniref:RING-type domain-containing protein n=2 Tax=Steinernema hermaphroditum TaxID=289476 RepID=A0AA39M4Y3_9BILA|nr:hypothetical protein QR680_014839 [Steinernema hermaphroditum]